MHGGKSPQALVAARRRAIEAEAAQAAARHDLVGVDPLEALSKLAAEVLVFKDYLRGQVAQMEELIAENQVYGTDEVRALVTLYERALDRSARILSDIARLNIDERLAKLNRARGEVVAGVFKEALADAALPPELHARTVAALVARIQVAMAESGSA